MRKKKKLHWIKYLTREYSFLYISYAIDCYSIMKETVGTTITFDISHGEGSLIHLYGIKKDIQNSYQMIEDIAQSNPDEIVRKMDVYDKLVAENYELFEHIRSLKDKKKIKKLLLRLDRLFLKTLCYYLFFVYLGYAGNLPAIKKFLKLHGKRFENIRLYTIDTDMDTKFPKLFGKYDERLVKLASYMHRRELISYITDKPVNFKKIKNRKIQYLSIMKDGKAVEYDLNQIDDVLNKELAHLKSNIKKTKVKGSIACKGSVKGTIKLIFKSSDYGKIEKGNIIVTPMTKPSITPLLGKIRGIITNDGGALCHASIISREFNIPCIVGTIDATDVFDDEDLVHLDANKGIAEKI